MPQIQPPPSAPTRQKPPATNYPSLNNLNLPRALTQAVTQSFQTAYAVRDQTTVNSDAINHMVQYGTHQARLDQSPQALPDGSLWFETDNPDVVYQVRLDPKSNSLQWFYATGMGFVPAWSLGENDKNYMAWSRPYVLLWTGTQWNIIFQGV
jgi:hypothetical protein